MTPFDFDTVWTSNDAEKVDFNQKILLGQSLNEEIFAFQLKEKSSSERNISYRS